MMAPVRGRGIAFAAAVLAGLLMLIGALALVNAVSGLPSDIPGREMYPDGAPDGTVPGAR